MLAATETTFDMSFKDDQISKTGTKIHGALKPMK
jgi:hypothetical protein